VWETTANNNLVKTGATDVNSVRGRQERDNRGHRERETANSVRAQIPGGDFKFGFHVAYN
jgi:hypothetical protein